MTPPEDLIIAIGEALMRAARATGEPWDYAGWMFETRDGRSSSGTDFQFAGRRQLSLEFAFDDMDVILDSFMALREATHVPGDAHWIKCLAVLRHDGEMKLLFEFKDWSRWSITPANVDRALEILVGEVFPEAIAPPG
ncbi:hypothetical protein [Roseomonas fluvialis]|uniref:Uncharacterized protein n=1 Tax=Roseomonas fluvialis TaxID=1750527 RepID=A0ABN6P520_9PROT|nr:hypothetical protein [Roseomonas fluvialis]BDG72858.1 hypothetical protein Rmf_27870 [Roseomonas fluvialis]